MQTYVYDGTEVVKTGRTATKQLKGSPLPRSITLVEIKPLDTTFEWKKWVDPNHLFTVSS